MKYLFLLFFIVTGLMVKAQDVFRIGKVEMTFDTTSIDLGKVKKGETREFSYTFTNTGEEDIKISIVSGCDCTEADWPRRIIKPGDKAVIPVTFDSSDKEKSETVDVDIYLENLDPVKGIEILKIVNYSFELVE